MTRQIILHQMNAAGVDPDAFVRLAADNACRTVTMFAYNGNATLPTTNTGLTYPTPISAESKDAVARALAETGVKLDGVEFFPITAEVDFEVYKPALVIGAELGARRAVGHIFIVDDTLAVDRIGEFCDLAESFGLKFTSEFCPMTAGNTSLPRAKWLVDQVGRDDFAIGVDMLHTVRSGAMAADLAALDPRYFGIVQICDAQGTQVSNDYIKDVHNRDIPGQGDLPLHDLLSAIPAGQPIEIEVPAQRRRASGISAAEHVRDVLIGTRAVVAGLTPTR
jgi:sugar phosphate isomerase/epimerase